MWFLNSLYTTWSRCHSIIERQSQKCRICIHVHIKISLYKNLLTSTLTDSERCKKENCPKKKRIVYLKTQSTQQTMFIYMYQLQTSFDTCGTHADIYQPPSPPFHPPSSFSIHNTTTHGAVHVDILHDHENVQLFYQINKINSKNDHIYTHIICI